MLEKAAVHVPLNGFGMQLRPSELESVAAGQDRFVLSSETEMIRLAEALRRLPVNDRAPTWELAVRHFGRHKPLPRAAGEIGMDVDHARALVDHLFGVLADSAPSS